MAVFCSRNIAWHRRFYRWCVDQPIAALTVVFGAWKVLLLTLAFLSPGPGYDTSTTLLDTHAIDRDTHLDFSPTPKNRELAPLLKLVRWDAIYFLSIARRGYVFEQEWAFSYVHGKLIQALSGFCGDRALETTRLALAGVIISHVSHYLATLVLYKLTILVFAARCSQGRVVGLGLVTSIFHIISPASAFLSAPYGEALCALLNFCGFYLYAASRLTVAGTARTRLSAATKLIVSGSFFALATLIRTNGMLSGTLFAYDAVAGAYSIVLRRQCDLSLIGELLAVFLGGAQILLAILWPQYIAYNLYCGPGSFTSPRSWCERTIPSIYTFVQAEYWNVGFLRYWTLSNLPLCLLAIPMIVLLLLSSFSVITGRFSIPCEQQQQQRQDPKTGNKLATRKADVGAIEATSALLRPLAVPQAVLAALALTNYHVQIINRIASGYPVWCWYLAALLFNTASPNEDMSSQLRKRRLITILSRSMILYALIQGVLFASFLPPA